MLIPTMVFMWWTKTGMLIFFILLVVRDIGADNTSQIIPVKTYASQSRYRVWLP